MASSWLFQNAFLVLIFVSRSLYAIPLIPLIVQESVLPASSSQAICNPHASDINSGHLLGISRFLSHEQYRKQFEQAGYVEICDKKNDRAAFDSLYAQFDELIEFLQKNPVWAKKLYSAKERFIRSKDRSFYSTDFFGFYDESKRAGRGQIAFYYSTHFHEFISSRYPEFNEIPEFSCFFQTCLEIQKPYGALFSETAAELGFEAIFVSRYERPPLLFKVVKYFPSYIASKPHYDGTAFSLFLDSTDNESLLLSPYKPSFTIDDFSSPLRQCSQNDSILLIPGALLTEFSIYPTPHIVLQSGKTRYATIAFAMRPHYIHQKTEFSPLPSFKD